MLNQSTFIQNIKNNNTLETLQLIDIFDHIKFDPILRDKTQRYQNIPVDNIQERKDFKVNTFPAFFPTVWLGQTEKNSLTDESLPTGLVQFDLDAKDNPNIDLSEVRKTLLNIHELYSLFQSPSGGIKFTIKTDFHKHFGDTIEVVRERFKAAYKITKAYVGGVLPSIILDDAVGTLKFACFLSHDSELYINAGCLTLVLDSKCFCSIAPREKLHTYDTVDTDKVAELLSFIPKNFRYNDRLGINSAVLNSIGKAGIPLLMAHWTTSNKVKLKKDLDYLLEHPTKHNLGYLFNQARKYGYPNAPTGRARKNLKTRDIIDAALATGQRVEGLKTFDEAREAVDEAVDRFIQNKINMVISSSVGIGKSEKVLNVLRMIPWNVSAMYVSNNHNLLNELKTRFNEMPREQKMGSMVSTITHIQGRNRLCENQEAIKAFGEIPISHHQCENDCPFFSQCAYTLQFQSFSNIRMVAANELFNDSSYFDNGWKPNLIIVDEDCQKMEVFTEGFGSRYRSLREIIQDTQDGLPLIESIKNNSTTVMLDYLKMKKEYRNKAVKWSNTSQFITEWKERQEIWSEILGVIHTYCLSDDETNLHGLRPIPNGLRMTRLSVIHSRFDGIPKLFLDATADERVFKHLYPDIEWVSVHAIKRESVKLIQAENFNITKTWLEKDANRKKLISACRRFIAEGDYKKVGLITYKNIKGLRDFDVYLGQSIGGVNVVNHFGNIRGKNDFEDCDLLIVAGRHELDKVGLEDWVYAVFDKCVEGAREYVEIPIRMRGNEWVSIENLLYLDRDVESIKNHICRSETHQAGGRIRWFSEHPDGLTKSVLLLSCESIGTNVEVDEWIRSENFLDEPVEVKSKEEIKADGLIKQKESRGEREFQKREGLLVDRELPDVLDDYKAFEELGFGVRFARDKNARSEFMVKAGYHLVDGIWSVNRD